MRRILPSRGFTLIELLIVMGILAVLLTITIIAINPAKQFDMARGTAKYNGAVQIAKALQQCWIDNGADWAKAEGECYSQVPTATLTTALSSNTPTGGVGGFVLIGNDTLYPTYYIVNLCPLITGGYIAQLPMDPDNNRVGAGKSTQDCSTSTQSLYGGYYLKIINNKITVAVSTGKAKNPSYTGPTSVTY